MSTTIPDIFIDDFESQVKHAYQRQGSLLLGTHRTSSAVQGDTVYFPKLGTATAYSKARGGQIPSSNTAHTRVSATLEEKWYRDDIEDYDQFKTNVEIRSGYSEAGAMALGRAQDQVILDALAAGFGTDVDETVGGRADDAGLDLSTLLLMKELAANANVPSGNLWWVIAPGQVTDLYNLTEFTSADFNLTKPFGQPTDGMFSFLGFKFIVHSGLPSGLEGAEVLRYTYLYDSSALGSASPNAMKMKTSIDKLVKEQAHQISSSWSMGSTVIDGNGVWRVVCNEG